MRKIKVLISLVAISVLCLMMFVGCGKREREITRPDYNDKEIMIESMNYYLGGVLLGRGEDIYNANFNNKQPFIQCALMMVETNNGTSIACSKLNNVGGLSDVIGMKLMRYNSISDSIADMAKRIKYNHDINEPLTNSVENIISIYTEQNHTLPADELHKYVTSVMLKYISLTDYAAGLKNK